MRADFIIAVTCSLFLGACSEKKAPEQPAPPRTETQTQTQGVIPQAQLDALNKAKNVENVIMQDADRQREQADQQGQ